jgi:hypothetical protein
MGRRKDIQYAYMMCPTSNEPLYDFPTSDIGYPIESDRRIALHKLHITRFLPTRYSINIPDVFGGYPI